MVYTRHAIIIVSVILFNFPALAQISERAVELGNRKVVSAVTYMSLLPISKEGFNDIATACAAQALSFDGFLAQDSSRSFVGAYSGRYYQYGNTTVYQGESNIVLFVAEQKPLVVARAREPLGGINSAVLQFNVALELQDNGILYTFENIKRAAGNSGLSANQGFTPVWQSFGSRYRRVYERLDDVTSRLDRCIQAQ